MEYLKVLLRDLEAYYKMHNLKYKVNINKASIIITVYNCFRNMALPSNLDGNGLYEITGSKSYLNAMMKKCESVTVSGKLR